MFTERGHNPGLGSERFAIRKMAIAAGPCHLPFATDSPTLRLPISSRTFRKRDRLGLRVLHGSDERTKGTFSGQSVVRSGF
jgi:hypothetical protein